MTRTLSSSPLPDAPPYGHLPSEIYLLKNWDAETTNPTAHRASLIRAFLNLGQTAREAYTDPLTPTPAQISSILEPWRPARLRAIASLIHHAAWVQTDYSDSAKASAFQASATQEAQEGTPEGIILSDPAIFNKPWETVLEVLPEVVTSADEDGSAGLVPDAIVDWKSADNEDDRRELELAVQNYAVAATVIVEDELSHAEGEDEDNGTVLQVLLDQHGNVIKSLRVEPQDAASLAWGDWSATWREAFGIHEDGDLGEEYRTGGRWAPPYSHV